MDRRLLTRLFLAPALAVACLCVAAAPAGAVFNVVIGGTSSMTAGTHGDVTIGLTFPDSGHDVEDMDLQLPPGLLGSPNAVTPCSWAEVAAANCPSSSQVGTTYVTTDIWLPEVLGGITLPDMGIGGSVYLMQPRGSEPARLYTQLGPYVDGTNTMTPIKLEAPIRLNSPGDYSLITELRGLPLQSGVNVFGIFPATGYTQLKAMSMTLWGTRGHMAQPFMTAPTACDPIRYKVSAKPYGSSTWTTAQSTAISVSGCADTPFSPSMAATTTPSTIVADQPTGVSVTMGFTPPLSGPAPSTVQSAEFVLPEGFALSASSGSAGLDACTDAQFAADDATTPTCPATSEVGSVSFSTPLIAEPIVGKVYIGEPAPGIPLRMLIHATFGTTHLKLSARALTDPTTGQVTTIFDGIPPVPFSEFTMNFRSGDHAMLKAPSVCGTQQAVARLEPASRPGTHVTVQADLTTTGCGAAQFAPRLEASFGGLLAGGDTSTTMTFERNDADERFGAMTVSLPTGLLGRLASVERCSLEDARAARCAESAMVGSVAVQAGTGNTPLTIDTGKVYLTDPEAGAVAGLAITIPAKVGPIDLGTAVVLAKMTVRDDLGIDVTTGAMPTIVGGVPLFVRSMTLRLDREGFLFNASSCTEQAISAQIGSIAGSSVTQNVAYLPTDCSAMAFAPVFSAKLGGDLKRPSLTATMLPREGDSTMSSMAMTLPIGLSAGRKALASTCSKADFSAGACPAVSRVGTATAISPLIPDPMSGPVYIVGNPGELPGLNVMLHGLIDIPLTIVNSLENGQLTSTVQSIPDVPLTRFDLALDANTLLEANVKSLCAGSRAIHAVFTGHSGSRSESSPVVDMTCPGDTTVLPPKPGRATATGSLRRIGSKAAFKLTVRGKAITGMRVILPRSAVRLKAAAVRGASLVKSGASVFGRGLVSAANQTISVKVPAGKRAAGVSSVSLDLAPAALRPAASLRRGKAVRVKVRVTYAGAGPTTLTLKLKTR